MQGVRGSEFTPGEFRIRQNWIGRLMITLYLCEKGILKRPLLYLQMEAETHRLRGG